MIDQNREITVLLSDDLGGRILDDAGTMEPWLLFHADKVLEYLANSPNAGISLSSRSEQLNNLRREDGESRRAQQFVQHRNTRHGASLGLPWIG